MDRKNWFKKILAMGWQGIKVWNTLISLGVVSLIRVAITHIWGATQYWSLLDQIMLYGGIFLTLLGILGFIVVRQASRPTNAQAPAKSSQQSSLDEDIQRVIIVGHETSQLTILKGIAGWPISYPLKIYNICPIALPLSGYKVTILLNNAPAQVVEWYESSPQASTGFLVDRIDLPPDQPIILRIIVNVAQIQNLPQESPIWGIRGELFFKGDTNLVTRIFDFSYDNYSLLQSDWDDLRMHITSS